MTSAEAVPSLSVVIPAHNSSAAIEETVGRLTARLSGMRAEIIVVENGSTDDTYERCLALADRWPLFTTVSFRVMRAERGMGNALRAGSRVSRGMSVLLTADDLPFDFSDLDAVAALGANGTPLPAVVIGSKAHPDSVAPRGIFRRAMTLGFGVLRRLILGMRTGDPQGTFIIDGALLRSIAPHLHEPGFLFTTELAFVLERMGQPPVEVPIRLSPNHGTHATRVRLSDIARMGLGLIRLRSRHASKARPVPSHSSRG